MRSNRHFFHSLRVPLVCLVLAVLAGTAHGQPAAPLHLDWDAAWALALEANEDHQAARLEREQANLQVLEAYSYAMPTLNLDGTLNHYFEIPSNPVTMPGELNFANPGQPFTTTFAFAQENTMMASAQLTQPLWLAGKVGLGVRIAKNYREISELGVDVSEQDLRVRLTESFYGVLIANESVDVARMALAQAERHRDRVQHLFDEGMVSEYDLIRARVAVSNLQPQVDEAEMMRALAERGLKNLLAVDLEREIVVDGELEDVILGPDMDFADASQRALDQRLELRQLELQRALYEDQQVVEARSWLWPNFLAGLRWETQAQSNKFDFPDQQFFNGLSAQLIVNIPLFDGLASHRRSQIAEVNIRNTRLQESQLRRGIELQTFQARKGFELAATKLQSALAGRAEAERGHEIAQTRYAEGVGTQLEVLDAQLQLNQSRINVLQAQYDQIVARARYDRAIGRHSTVD